VLQHRSGFRIVELSSQSSHPLQRTSSVSPSSSSSVTPPSCRFGGHRHGYSALHWRHRGGVQRTLFRSTELHRLPPELSHAASGRPPDNRTWRSNSEWRDFREMSRASMFRTEKMMRWCKRWEERKWFLRLEMVVLGWNIVMKLFTKIDLIRNHIYTGTKT
jgi:hypothetical protein